MTREQAKEILRHWDNVVWRSENHITMGDVSDALHIAEEALNEPTQEKFIDKACRWLDKRLEYYAEDTGKINYEQFFEDFRKTMAISPEFEGVKGNLTTAATNPWHSVADGDLPKMEYHTKDGSFSNLCICINEDYEYNILVLCEDEENTYWAFGYNGQGFYDNELDGGEITHWMPIPELPKED